MVNYKRDNRVLIVGNGFTFFGFVFVWGWLFSKGLWQQGFFVLLLYIPIYFFHSIIMATILETLKLPEFYLLIPTLILFLTHIYVGLKGNQWQHSSLVNRGYKRL